MIEAAFEAARGKSVLFLGRLKNFTEEEVRIFLKQYDAEFSTQADETTAVMIESTMLNPIEEELSYTLYKQKIPTFRMDQFETLYAQKITPNSLLMSLKLSNDQSRLMRLLKNEAFDKSLYLKLFKLYDWKGEGVHESDENRDVTTTFVKRFYQSGHFMDPAIIYSPITLTAIVAESEDPEVLDAVLSMPRYEIKVSRSEAKKPKTLREMIALNPYAAESTLRALARLKNRNIDYFLAQNEALSVPLQEQIEARADQETKIVLAQNAHLSEGLFEKLLGDEAEVVRNLLVFQKMDKERFEKVKKSSEFAYLGENERIEKIVDVLLECDDLMLQRRLAANPTVSCAVLEHIYTRYGEQVAAELCINPNLSAIMIEAFAKAQNPAWDVLLAANPATPEALLIGYFKRGDEALNLSLASNESMPLAYLRELQLDPLLMNALSNNKTLMEDVLSKKGI